MFILLINIPINFNNDLMFHFIKKNSFFFHKFLDKKYPLIQLHDEGISTKKFFHRLYMIFYLLTSFFQFQTSKNTHRYSF